MASRIPLIINGGQIEQLPSGDTLNATLTNVTDALLPGGRLTLSSGDPLAGSDQTAKTTVYYTPYVHGYISLYNSTDSAWYRVKFTEKSVAVPSTTATPFDVFGYLSSGDLALETLDWTNGTTRATDLARFEGALVKSGDSTRLYLGTGRTTSSSGQCEDSVTKRFLVNYYNRRPRTLVKSLSGAGYTYSVTTVRQTNGDTGNKVEFVVGFGDTWLFVQSTQYLISSAAETASNASVALDSTTVHSGRSLQFSLNLAGAGVLVGSTIQQYPNPGYHAANALENGAGTGTQTWFPGGTDRGLFGYIEG